MTFDSVTGAFGVATIRLHGPWKNFSCNIATTKNEMGANNRMNNVLKLLFVKEKA